MQQEPKSRRQRTAELISLLAPSWRPTPWQGLWAIRIGIVLGLLVAIGYYYGVTLWDWIKLLIVPAAIAGAGLWFNTQQRKREQRIEDIRAQDDSLQAYLDGMSKLLTDREQPLHSAQPGDSLSTVARARTLTVLGRLDGGRKRSVLQFLYESGLIHKERTFLNKANLIERQHNIVSLKHASLRGAFLRDAYLSDTDLSQTDLMDANLSEAYLHWANLRGANLRGANLSEAELPVAILSGADLRGANLIGADLSDADLAGANLKGANLRGANLRGTHLFFTKLPGAYLYFTNLSEAYLYWANLREANLSGAILGDANLSGADLSGANLIGAQGWTEDQLSEARTLAGATMPDGQILQGDAVPDGPTFEKRLKSQGRGEDE